MPNITTMTMVSELNVAEYIGPLAFDTTTDKYIPNPKQNMPYR